MKNGWIGVDFDGTIVKYDSWKGPEFEDIGAPIWNMVDRVKAWLAKDVDVQIVTARAHPDNPFRETNIASINRWCETFLGRKLPIRCDKDMHMTELWDDRCVQLIPNTGARVDGQW